MLKNKFLSFVILAIVTYSASFIGGIATYSSKEPWYSALVKSNLNPPDWVFGPVWTTLYLFMTVAIWSAWHKNRKNVNLVYYYLIHLLFNTTWSIVFFVFHNIFLALINLIILILFIIFLMLKYKKVSQLSYYLMIPYLLWCCYALILNLSLFVLN
jgi:tryptophan-rich sensory protein